MKRALTYFLSALISVSCIYPFDIDTEQYSGNTLVIDGNIVIGGSSTVRLSRLTIIGEQKSPERIVATVTLEGEKGQSLTRDSEPYTFNTADWDPDCRYRLVVKEKEKVYASTWTKPLEAPKITSIDFDADETMVYVRMSAQASGDGQGYASAQYDEIWRFHTDYLRIFEYDPESNSVYPIQDPDGPDMTYYACWRKQTGWQNIIIDYSATNGVISSYPIAMFPRKSNRNHYEYKIMVKLRTLPEEEYRYRRQLESGQNLGSLFSPEPGSAPTNIICESDPSVKIFGYVSISRQDYYIATLDSKYLLYGNPGGLDVIEPDQYQSYYLMGYLPVNYTPTGEIGWGSPRCYNCVADGGTLEEPSFDIPKGE